MLLNRCSLWDDHRSKISIRESLSKKKMLNFICVIRIRFLLLIRTGWIVSLLNCLKEKQIALYSKKVEHGWLKSRTCQVPKNYHPFCGWSSISENICTRKTGWSVFWHLAGFGLGLAVCVSAALKGANMVTENEILYIKENSPLKFN